VQESALINPVLSPVLNEPSLAVLPSSPPNDLLLQRIGILEHEVKQLQKAHQHEKRLLRKAILLQMDMDVDDEDELTGHG